MRCSQIDLHGLNEQEATGEILMALFDFKTQNIYDELTIITGVGTGYLMVVAEDLLSQDNQVTYQVFSGKIIVYKNYDNYDEDDFKIEF